MCQTQAQYKLESALPSLFCFLERAPGEVHGHTLPPSTLHRWPPKDRTLCFPEASSDPEQTLCNSQYALSLNRKGQALSSTLHHLQTKSSVPVW